MGRLTRIDRTTFDSSTGEVKSSSFKIKQDRRWCTDDESRGGMPSWKFGETLTFNKGLSLEDYINNDSDYVKMVRLIMKIGNYDNVIYYKPDDGKYRIADFDDIKSIIKLTSNRRTREFIDRMKKLNILVEYKTESSGVTAKTFYIISPVWVTKGKYVSVTLYYLFRDQISFYYTKEENEKYEELIDSAPINGTPV